jgi:hypothetical protein
MSFFEAGMLVCFGAAWPFSIYRSYKSRSNSGKSLVFLLIVVTGYILGMLHKVIYNFDGVFYLYAFNCLMVLADTAVYFRNRALAAG